MSSIWDEVIENLVQNGVATIKLSSIADWNSTNRNYNRSFAVSNKNNNNNNNNNNVVQIHANAFQQARKALDEVLYNDKDDDDSEQSSMTNDSIKDSTSCCLPIIPHDADSAHVTGFHFAGGLSRYNMYREGIIFSNDFRQVFKGKDDNIHCTFYDTMTEMFDSMHTIADHVLNTIEKLLDLPHGWFQQYLGPTNTSSQWHIKRFVNIRNNENIKGNDESENTKDTFTETGERIILPMHTDPSIISIVVHDVPSSLKSRTTMSHDQNDNSIIDDDIDQQNISMGLQYHDTKSSKWIELKGTCGHGYATIFLGSVMTYITSGIWTAVKHRVVEKRIDTCNGECCDGITQQRMAATLFIRPQPKATLSVPLPSRVIQKELKERQWQRQRQNEDKNLITVGYKTKPAITFETWLKRVARNYEKKQEKVDMK